MSMLSSSSAFQRSPPSIERDRFEDVSILASSFAPVWSPLAAQQPSEPMRLATLRSAAAALSQAKAVQLDPQTSLQREKDMSDEVSNGTLDVNGSAPTMGGDEVEMKTRALYLSGNDQPPLTTNSTHSAPSSIGTKGLLVSKEFTPKVTLFVSSCIPHGGSPDSANPVDACSSLTSNPPGVFPPKSGALIRTVSFEGVGSLRRSASAQQRADLQVLRGILGANSGGSHATPSGQPSMELLEVNEKVFQDTRTSMSCDSMELSRIPSFTSQLGTSASALDEYASLRQADPVVEAFLRLGTTDDVGTNATSSSFFRSSSYMIGSERDEVLDEDGDDEEVYTTLSLSCLDEFVDDTSMNCSNDETLSFLDSINTDDVQHDVFSGSVTAPSTTTTSHLRASTHHEVPLPTPAGAILSVSVSPVNVTLGDRKRRRSLPAGTTATAIASMTALASGGASGSFTLGSAKHPTSSSPHNSDKSYLITGSGHASVRPTCRTLAKPSSFRDSTSSANMHGSDSRVGTTTTTAPSARAPVGLARGTKVSRPAVSKSVGAPPSGKPPSGHTSVEAQRASDSPYSDIDCSVASISSAATDTDAEVHRAFRLSPRLVEYGCSVCKSVYHELSASNVFSSCRLARCPHCGASQFPTVELHSPINAFEHDPSVAVLFEETNVSYGSDGDTSEDAGLGCYLDPKLPCKENAHTGSTTPSPCNSVDKIHSALTSILSPCTSTEESCVSNTSRCAWGRQSIPLLLPKQTAAELLVLMTHARLCTQAHVGRSGADACQNIKLMMLHARDCPYPPTAASSSEASSVPLCGYIWCREVKSVASHLLHCDEAEQCEVCFPKCLPPTFAQLVRDNDQALRRRQTQRGGPSSELKEEVSHMCARLDMTLSGAETMVV